MSFFPLSIPIAYQMPERLTDVSSWHGLIPLAFVLMDLNRTGGAR
jgi:hypothetical protein